MNPKTPETDEQREAAAREAAHKDFDMRSTSGFQQRWGFQEGWNAGAEYERTRIAEQSEKDGEL